MSSLLLLRDPTSIQLSLCCHGTGLTKLADSVFRVQALPYGSWVHPSDPDEQLIIDQMIVQTIVKNFEDDVLDNVPVPWRHTDHPAENTGFVLAAIETEDGLDLIINVPEAKDQINKELIGGISLSIDFEYMDKKSGDILGPTMLHCALVSNPYIKGMRKFEQLGSEELEQLGLQVEKGKIAAGDSFATPLFLQDRGKSTKSQVQTIGFDRQIFKTIGQVKEWLKGHKFSSGKIEKTGNETSGSFRATQAALSGFTKFRSQKVANGVTLVFGIKSKSASMSECGDDKMTLEELLALLKNEHSIDVTKLQDEMKQATQQRTSVIDELRKFGDQLHVHMDVKASAKDLVATLSEPLTKAVEAKTELDGLRKAVAAKVQLADGQKLTDLIVAKIDNATVLSDRVLNLEAEKDVETLLIDKKILPAEKAHFVELRKSNRELFEKMTKDRKPVDVQLGENGTDTSTDEGDGSDSGKTNPLKLSDDKVTSEVDRYSKQAEENTKHGLSGVVAKRRPQVSA